MIDAFGFTTALALLSLGSGQGMGEGGQDPRGQSVGVVPAEGAARTIRIEWDDTYVGARVRLKDGTTIRWRGTQVPEGGAIIELPLHESWTFCFLNHGSGLTIDGLRRLQPDLRRIRVPGIEIYNCWEMSDEMLRLISEVTSLERVVLGDQISVVRGQPSGMTAAGLRQLAKLPKLEHAFLVCLDYLTDEDFAVVVAALPQLRSVGFYGCGVDRRTLQAVVELRSVQDLALRYCWAIGDDDLKALASKTTLQGLDLYDSPNVTGSFLRTLSTLTHLRRLNIGSCDRIEGRVLEWLGAFKELEYLDLTKLDDLTDDGLATVSSLPKLHTLVMIDCREVDDAALQQLARNSSLKKVFLRGTKVTAVGIDAFREGNPQCEVDQETRYSPWHY